MIKTLSRQSFCHNYTFSRDNKFARRAFTKSSHFFILAEFPAQIITYFPPPTITSIDQICQEPMKIYAAIIKLLGQNPRKIACEQLLQALFLNLYYENSHLKCYHVWQQFENHFKIVGANGGNQIPFAASFL